MRDMISDKVISSYMPNLIQANHWLAASRRLLDLDALASSQAWKGLEHYVNQNLRQQLSASVQALVNRGERMLLLVKTGSNSNRDIARMLQNFRKDYLRVEMLLDFYADALATRTNPEICAMLKACDYIAGTSMRRLLEPLKYTTPPVVTYIEKGEGAAILKADLQLWDGTRNPVAAIKVTRHNLLRPTALIHEAGHQVAHITNWNDELAGVLRSQLQKYGDELANTWASWSSEIAADVFAFVNAGFASVASLHDVVDGPSGDVFRFIPGDPHPISFLRVLTGIECCQQAFGNGIWNDMRSSWMAKHAIGGAREKTAALIRHSLPLLPQIVNLLLHYPLRAFQGNSIVQRINVTEVGPRQLEQAAGIYGKAFYQSTPLLLQAPLLRLAWNGYQLVTDPAAMQEHLAQQKSWMNLLGNSIQ